MLVKIRKITIIRICEIIHDFSIYKFFVRIHQMFIDRIEDIEIFLVFVEFESASDANISVYVK